MLNAESLDRALIALAEKRIELSQLNYNDESYDELEEELHDMEDTFVDTYGKELEHVLEEIHEKYCPESDVLLPTAYLAKRYIRRNEQVNGRPVYDVAPKEGVWVELDANPGKEAHLVLVPSPARILLTVGTKEQKEVWRAGK